MKRPGPRLIGFIGVISNVVAWISLVLPYATPYFRDAPQAVLKSGAAWELLLPVVDARATSVPIWYYLLSGLLLLSIVFPLSVHLASLKGPLARNFFLWSSLAALGGVIWCLFIDALILGIGHYGSTQAYRFEPGAALLLFCLLLSVGCDIYQREQSKKADSIDAR